MTLYGLPACRARKKNGLRCQQPALKGFEFCAWHFPTRKKCEFVRGGKRCDAVVQHDALNRCAVHSGLRGEE